MRALHVFRQRRAAAKLAPAPRHLALVRAHTRVRAAVARQRACIGKCLVALGAGEWACTRVDIDMYGERAALDKAFVATVKGARVRPLLGVRADMPGVRSGAHLWRSERRANALEQGSYEQGKGLFGSETIAPCSDRGRYQPPRSMLGLSAHRVHFI